VLNHATQCPVRVNTVRIETQQRFPLCIADLHVAVKNYSGNATRCSILYCSWATNISYPLIPPSLSSLLNVNFATTAIYVPSNNRTTQVFTQIARYFCRSSNKSGFSRKISIGLLISNTTSRSGGTKLLTLYFGYYQLTMCAKTAEQYKILSRRTQVQPSLGQGVL
jgi:hypothetical protein